MTGILGKKLGMTQIFAEDGKIFPVTVVETEEKKLAKPLAGVFKKAGVKPYRILKEFPMSGLKVGEFVTVEKFTKGDKISVKGISKGKGFQGVMKRHHYAGGPGSHGSMFNRAPGSIGSSSFPSRVWKNKALPGHMGSEKVTTKNLEVVDVKNEQNLLLIKGAVPGANGGLLEIRKED